MLSNTQVSSKPFVLTFLYCIILYSFYVAATHSAAFTFILFLCIAFVAWSMIPSWLGEIEKRPNQAVKFNASHMVFKGINVRKSNISSIRFKKHRDYVVLSFPENSSNGQVLSINFEHKHYARMRHYVAKHLPNADFVE